MKSGEESIYEKKWEELNIINKILQIALKPTTKAEIMYEVKLDSTQIERYLHLLNQLGYIKSEDLIIFQTTERGKRLTCVFQEIKNLLETAEKLEPLLKHLYPSK